MRGIKNIRNFLKQIFTTQTLCLCLICIYLFVMFAQPPEKIEIQRKELDFILILCGGQGSHKGAHASDTARQVNQAEVMLKSATLFSKKRMHFHVLADSMELYSSLVNRTVGWPDNFRRKLKFSYHTVWYPEDRSDMKTMFRVCATERLFVPDIFPKLDKAIYIDTDLIFMRPAEDLWSFFHFFDTNQLAAMAPCLYHYGSERNKIPFYGDSGLNAGIMHMDLDKMRAMPDGWTNTNLAMYDKYAPQIKLADQDILNILFYFYPERLFELPCEWNYRVWLCSQGENKCPGAEYNGVSILHGNALAFVQGHEMKIQKIYEAFQAFQLGKDKPGMLFNQIKAGLAQVDHADMSSKCKSVANIDDILLGELKNHIAGARLTRKY